MNKNYPDIDDIDIIYFWKNYSYTSKFSGQKRNSNKIKFQKYITDNNILTTFQVDLITYMFKKNDYIYVLLVIDQVSKYVFCTFFNRKKENNLLQGFKTVIKYIKEKKEKNLFSSLNENMRFFADFGEEFKFKKVVNYIESLNSKIIQIGSPKISKLGIIERAIRTIQEKLAFYLDDIHNKKQYKKYFKHILRIYNNDNHSFLNTTPNKYINSTNILKIPWNMYNSNNTFNYKDNKDKIRKKLNIIKQKYKIMQPVRRKIILKKVYKRSHYTNWSDEIFFIDGYKIPLKKNESIGIYLIDRLGNRKKGISYSENLKKVLVPNYNKIKKIWEKMTKRKMIRCSFENFPNSFYRDIKISDLKQFIIPKRIRKEIDDWRKENDI